MSTLEAILAQLGRTPEEHVAYWAARQKEEYEKWWELGRIVSEVGRLGADEDETADLVAQAREGQLRIHHEQAERALIRDRYADEQDNR